MRQINWEYKKGKLRIMFSGDSTIYIYTDIDAIEKMIARIHELEKFWNEKIEAILEDAKLNAQKVA